MLVLIDEKSKSKTGKHAVRKIPLIIYPNGKIENINGKKIRVKPTYVKGYAYQIHFKPPKEAITAQVNLIKCLGGKVKGEIILYEHSGKLILRAVYRKMKVRKVEGDPAYATYVKLICKYLRIPVKRYSLGDKKRLKI